jgi:glycerophosphoryl diester phosphodiesterase
VDSRPLIIAHRGDRKNFTENTIPAFEHALLQGATGLEIDVRACGSGEIVVFHDFSLKRMFNLPGYIGKTKLDQLREIPYSGTKPPVYIDTLDAFLDRFKRTVPINLDAKTIHFFDFGFADKLIGILKNHDMMDTVWISCFNPFLLQILKLKSKKIRTGYLFQRTTWIHTTYDLITLADAWHPHFRVLTRWLVDRAERHGKELYVWTVNDPETLKKVLQFPVDGLITDDVELIKQSL